MSRIPTPPTIDASPAARNPRSVFGNSALGDLPVSTTKLANDAK